MRLNACRCEASGISFVFKQYFINFANVMFRAYEANIQTTCRLCSVLSNNMIKKILRIFRWVVALTFISTILAVVVYRFIPVYFTPLMISRCFEQIGKGEHIKLYHKWIPLDEMPKSMPVAVMASEDQRFLIHHGFDYQSNRTSSRRSLKKREKTSWRLLQSPSKLQKCISMAGTFMG